MITDAPQIITSRFDRADSHTLAGYEATGGYQALRKALSMDPTAVADEVKTAILTNLLRVCSVRVTPSVVVRPSFMSAVKCPLPKNALPLH